MAKPYVRDRQLSANGLSSQLDADLFLEARPQWMRRGLGLWPVVANWFVVVFLLLIVD